MDSRMTSSSSDLLSTRDPLVDFATGEPRSVEVWDGILHEFRNHLRVLSAAALELRSEMPPTLALHVSESVHEMERNLQGLSSLLVLADSSLRQGEPVVSGIDQVLERAVRLAAPSVGRRVSIVVSQNGPIGVKNQGRALECLLAALVIELARAGVDSARETRIEAHVEESRGSLAIAIESSGARPPDGSWRVALAVELAARLGATIVPTPDAAAFVVQFR
jgi:hypothetical protein